MSLRPEVLTWSRGEEVVLYHRLTGRHAALGASTLEHLDGPRLEPVRRRLRSLYMLEDGPAAPVERLVAVPSRLALLLHQRPALWLPVPSRLTAGGHAWQARPLEPWQAAVWVKMNGARTVSQVIDQLGLPSYAVRAFLAELADPEVQALQLRDEPPHPRDLSLERLVAPPRPEAERVAAQYALDGRTHLGDYHRVGIHDGATHFDDRETTLAHTLALAHPSLGGRRYGAALREALAARGLVPDQGLVVEVGCGTGELAAAWRSLGRSHRYLRVDLSPELLATQARSAPDTEGVQGDATHLPLEDGSVDLLVSNEVLADLSSVPVGEAGPPDDLAALHQRHGIPFRSGWVNLGAWQMVQEVARVLRPGGAAWLSEFGDPDQDPQETVQLDHPEVSIHFGELAAVARSCGLQVELLPLAEVLGMDLSARWLWRPHFQACQALCRGADVHLQARAFTAESVLEHLPEPLYGLRDVPMSWEGPGPVVTRFWSLLLRRPVTAR